MSYSKMPLSILKSDTPLMWWRVDGHWRKWWCGESVAHTRRYRFAPPYPSTPTLTPFYCQSSQIYKM